MPASLAALVLAMLPRYYVPVYTPVYFPTPVVTTPDTKIVDPLPADSTKRNGRLSSVNADTLSLILPTVVVGFETDSGCIDGDTSACERGWADSALERFSNSLRERIARSSKIDSSFRPGTPVVVGTDVDGATRPVLVVDGFLHRTLRSGSGLLQRRIRNLVVTWGLWDPSSRKWIVRGRRSLRTARTESRDISPTEAGDYLAKQVYEAAAPHPVADPGDVKRRRKAFGGIHVLGDLGLALNVSGDSRKIAQEEIDEDARVSAVDFGARVLLIPDWYGFGAGFSFGSMEVSVDKRHGTMWERASFYGLAQANLPVSKGASESSRNVLTAGLCVGRESYESGDIWAGSFSGSGLFYRPELGFTMVTSAFVVGVNGGLQFNRLDIDGTNLEDNIFRMGILLGFRAGYDR